MLIPVSFKEPSRVSEGARLIREALNERIRQSQGR